MIPLSYVALWSRTFALTLLVEALVALPLLQSDASRARRFGAICAAQLLTHPAVWFIFPALGWRRFTYLTIAEVWAVAAEMVFYRLVFAKLAWSRSLGVSALANGASLAAGMLLQ